MTLGTADPAAAGNGAIAIQFQAERLGGAVPEPRCSASHHITMNKCSEKALWLLTLVAGTTLLVNAADSELGDLPELSTAGLEIECHPEKTKFVIGEPIILRCAITNTTDTTKRIRSHSPYTHFRCVKNEASWFSGACPKAALEIRPPIKRIEYEILLPAHTQLDVVLTLKSSRAQVFSGILVYDPGIHGGGFFGSDSLEKAKRACLFSKTFEYEVTGAETKK